MENVDDARQELETARKRRADVNRRKKDRKRALDKLRSERSSVAPEADAWVPGESAPGAAATEAEVRLEEIASEIAKLVTAEEEAEQALQRAEKAYADAVKAKVPSLAEDLVAAVRDALDAYERLGETGELSAYADVLEAQERQREIAGRIRELRGGLSGSDSMEAKARRLRRALKEEQTAEVSQSQVLGWLYTKMLDACRRRGSPVESLLAEHGIEPLTRSPRAFHDGVPISEPEMLALQENRLPLETPEV